ncbi:hypothetical protein MAPG_00723 [Magnaporthiopsis poae ATCC 64411]|uniref:Chromosome transmission fidelity protein 8 n=1 Tax=Magnaporthiopsis poae (strain ATCC 64411 / 73-15) TaxID=644358 RepID=A0A0C4DLS8_MAGP6|nr:hypothetical protein MAPG_00723 [Magnaporthiopsis poae ATCC 64411]
MSASTATLHPPQRQPPASAPALQNPLPPLLHTPSGLALLELQGVINTGEDDGSDGAPAPTRVGRLDFPEYVEGRSEDGGAWMRRVYLYVGLNQRLTGEIKKLPRPVAVIRRRGRREGGGDGDDDGDGGDGALEVVEIVRYKLLFSQRPEPIGVPGE